MTTTPPGWYPDNNDPTQVRWWNGAQWTEHTQLKAPTSQPEQSVPASGGFQGSKPKLFGKGKALDEAHAEIARLQSELKRLGVLDITDLQAERDGLRREVATIAEQARAAKAQADQQRSAIEANLLELRQDVVDTEEAAILQEVGIYKYRHPLDDSVAYRAELARLQEQIKAMVKKDGGAVTATTTWQVDGSAAKGRKMVRDISKLMLRAYNAEADTLVRAMKPYKLDSATQRLETVAFTIERLGKSMSIRVSPEYHRLRIRELELTADYLERVAEEKEREREERERLREERRAQQEIERERQRLGKERTHFEQAIAKLESSGDTEGAERLREQLASVVEEIEAVDFRARTLTAGHVYVISNIGSFGEGVLKIGMTRRLEPMDRVRELGDASVPFVFDVHALYFSDDAVRIEREMHQRFADRRVNRVNNRKEFFATTPAEVRDALAELSGEILTFTEEPEALEYRQGFQVTGATAQPPRDQVRLAR